MLPTQVGRYQIIEELGRGAMGVVYRGYDPTIGRTVAVKTLQLDAGDTELVMRFRREVQAAGVLSHPNIVTIYDAGEDQGLFYIAMELVEGETLQKMLAQGPLPVEQVIRLAEQIAAALDHAHGHYIVHRDVKPANIIVSGGHVKVMDFGIAKVTGATMTGTGQVLGTPSYMSPEVVKGQGADSRSDLFSLGVMLYEMLTGARPFLGDNITTVIYKILGEHPEPPNAANPALDPGVNYVVLKALAKNPAERYQSCGELAVDLKNHAAYRERGQRMAQAAAARGPAVAAAAVPAAPVDDGAASATLPLDARTVVMGRGQAAPAAAEASAATVAAAPAAAAPWATAQASSGGHCGRCGAGAGGSRRRSVVEGAEGGRAAAAAGAACYGPARRNPGAAGSRPGALRLRRQGNADALKTGRNRIPGERRRKLRFHPHRRARAAPVADAVPLQTAGRQAHHRGTQARLSGGAAGGGVHQERAALYRDGTGAGTADRRGAAGAAAGGAAGQRPSGYGAALDSHQTRRRFYHRGWRAHPVPHPGQYPAVRRQTLHRNRRRGFAGETHEVTIRKDDMTDLELTLTPAAEKRRRFLPR